MKNKEWIAASLTLLAMTLAGCSGYKTPSVSNASSMSGDTLCYRAAYAKRDEAVKNEIAARNLDCGSILEEQAPPPGFAEPYDH